MISRPLRAIARTTLPLLGSILVASRLAALDSGAPETEGPVVVVRFSQGSFERDGWVESDGSLDAALFQHDAFFSGRSLCADKLCKHPPAPPEFEGASRPPDDPPLRTAGLSAPRVKE